MQTGIKVSGYIVQPVAPDNNVGVVFILFCSRKKKHFRSGSIVIKNKGESVDVPIKGSLGAAQRLSPEEPPGQMVTKEIVFFF